MDYLSFIAFNYWVLLLNNFEQCEKKFLTSFCGSAYTTILMIETLWHQEWKQLSISPLSVFIAKTLMIDKEINENFCGTWYVT